MGEAKRRGTYEERKAAAIKRKELMETKIMFRRESPKLTKTRMKLAAILAMTTPPTARIEG